MILGDKIARLRKQNGWSQEELAEKLSVSRQAVSKWESAQTVPDIQRILQLAELFGVSTDYLLKDSMETEQFTGDGELPSRRLLTLGEANEFLLWKKSASTINALGVFLCIIALIPPLITGAVSVHRGMPPTMGIISAAFSAVILVAAIGALIYCGMRSKPYEFMEREPFYAEYGVEGMARERQKALRPAYMRACVIGVCLCVISAVPLILSAIIGIGGGIAGELLLALMLLSAGIGVLLLVMYGIRWASLEKLLQEGDYAPEQKLRSRLRETVTIVYWLVVTAIFLVTGFAYNWGDGWIVWAVAGVLYGAVAVIGRSAWGRRG